MTRDEQIAHLILHGFYPGQTNGGMAISNGRWTYWMGRKYTALSGAFGIPRPHDETEEWGRISEAALNLLTQRANRGAGTT